MTWSNKIFKSIPLKIIKIFFSPVGMRMRKKELELDAAESPSQPFMLETLHVVRDKGPADVDLESRLLDPVLG